MVWNALYRDKLCFLCASTGSEHKNMGAGGTSGTSLSSLFYLPTSWYLWLEGKMPTFKFFLNCIFIVLLAYNETLQFRHTNWNWRGPNNAQRHALQEDSTLIFIFFFFVKEKKKPQKTKEKLALAFTNSICL